MSVYSYDFLIQCIYEVGCFGGGIGGNFNDVIYLVKFVIWIDMFRIIFGVKIDIVSQVRQGFDDGYINFFCVVWIDSGFIDD